MMHFHDNNDSHNQHMNIKKEQSHSKIEKFLMNYKPIMGFNGSQLSLDSFFNPNADKQRLSTNRVTIGSLTLNIMYLILSDYTKIKQSNTLLSKPVVLINPSKIEQILNISRRRIYDVLHVLATLGIVTRISNKQYLFVGFEPLSYHLFNRYEQISKSQESEISLLPENHIYDSNFPFISLITEGLLNYCLIEYNKKKKELMSIGISSLPHVTSENVSHLIFAEIYTNNNEYSSNSPFYEYEKTNNRTMEINNCFNHESQSSKSICFDEEDIQQSSIDLINIIETTKTNNNVPKNSDNNISIYNPSIISNSPLCFDPNPSIPKQEIYQSKDDDKNDDESVEKTCRSVLNSMITQIVQQESQVIHLEIPNNIQLDNENESSRYASPSIVHPKRIFSTSLQVNQNDSTSNPNHVSVELYPLGDSSITSTNWFLPQYTTESMFSSPLPLFDSSNPIESSYPRYDIYSNESNYKEDTEIEKTKDNLFYPSYNESNELFSSLNHEPFSPIYPYTNQNPSLMTPPHHHYNNYNILSGQSMNNIFSISPINTITIPEYPISQYSIENKEDQSINEFKDYKDSSYYFNSPTQFDSVMNHSLFNTPINYDSNSFIDCSYNSSPINNQILNTTTIENDNEMDMNDNDIINSQINKYFKDNELFQSTYKSTESKGSILQISDNKVNQLNMNPHKKRRGRPRKVTVTAKLLQGQSVPDFHIKRRERNSIDIINEVNNKNDKSDEIRSLNSNEHQQSQFFQSFYNHNDLLLLSNEIEDKIMISFHSLSRKILNEYMIKKSIHQKEEKGTLKSIERRMYDIIGIIEAIGLIQKMKKDTLILDKSYIDSMLQDYNINESYYETCENKQTFHDLNNQINLSSSCINSERIGETEINSKVLKTVSSIKDQKKIHDYQIKYQCRYEVASLLVSQKCLTLSEYIHTPIRGNDVIMFMPFSFLFYTSSIEQTWINAYTSANERNHLFTSICTNDPSFYSEYFIQCLLYIYFSRDNDNNFTIPYSNNFRSEVQNDLSHSLERLSTNTQSFDINENDLSISSQITKNNSALLQRILTKKNETLSTNTIPLSIEDIDYYKNPDHNKRKRKSQKKSLQVDSDSFMDQTLDTSHSSIDTMFDHLSTSKNSDESFDISEELERRSRRNKTKEVKRRRGRRKGRSTLVERHSKHKRDSSYRSSFLSSSKNLMPQNIVHIPDLKERTLVDYMNQEQVLATNDNIDSITQNYSNNSMNNPSILTTPFLPILETSSVSNLLEDININERSNSKDSESSETDKSMYMYTSAPSYPIAFNNNLSYTLSPRSYTENKIDQGRKNDHIEIQSITPTKKLSSSHMENLEFKSPNNSTDILTHYI